MPRGRLRLAVNEVTYMHRDGLDLGLMQVAIDVLAVLQFLSLDIQRVEIVPDANYIFVNVVHLNIFKVKFKTAQCLDVRMALKRRPRHRGGSTG